MKLRSIGPMVVLAASSAALPQVASAHVPPPVTAFGVVAIGDVELGSIRGGYVGDDRGTPMIDAQARSDFRMSADVGTITFDNWFVDVAAPMIINARLAGLR